MRTDKKFHILIFYGSLTFLIAFGLMAEGNTMEKQITSIAQLVQAVESNPVRCEKMPIELAQSYPVPVHSGNVIMMAFMYFFKRGMPPAPPELSPPRFLVLANPLTGEILEIKQVKPIDFGINWPEEKSVGVYDLPPEKTLELFLQKQKQLFTLYDKILPLYENSGKAIDSEGKKTLAEFYELFNELVEKPLLPYYKALNPDFFPWIEGLVNSQ